jgi:hypothetical protein
MVLLWGTTAALLVIGWNDVRKVRVEQHQLITLNHEP